MTNYLGIATVAVIGIAVGSYLTRDSMSAEVIKVPQDALVTSIPFREVAVDNMTLRQNANVELNHLYGGVPNPTPINLIEMITGATL